MEIAVYCGKVYSWTEEICKYNSKYPILDYNSVVNWVSSHGEGSFLIFGTDVIPYSLYDYPNRPVSETEIFKFMERGGTVIWVGDIPFYYVDKNGVKEEIFSKGNPFPFIPENLEHRPVSEKSENSIVGEMLEYDPKESWRPVGANQSLVPISIVKQGGGILYSTWIYKYGRGEFVRVYDSPYVNAKYVLSLPEKLSKLGIGIRIRNHRKLKDFKMVLPNFKIGVILGKNNVGKTSVLEAIAMLDPNNANKIKEFRGSVSNQIAETELYLNGEYYTVEFSDVSSRRNKDAKVLLIYPRENSTVNFDQSILRKVTDLMNKFDPNIFYVYLSARNEIRVLFNDKTDVSINELGYGYKSLLNFILSYVIYQPKIILIDDLESFALHPELLKQFYDFLLRLDVDLILITTQSSDVYAYLAEKRSDNVRFILINDGKYEVLTSEEVLNRMDYEDLRYTALKLSSEVL
ncbi:ATP-binding protein [Sulfolobus sp. S-194]|uniref:ATP-dependent nuclease n=1 Tax=Sulfolobus sp. S-194 TaxID=2512240 RepID=UPI001437224C|nr:AAA family ATPase [Sulfolobus sp. S-194]QIW24530.1 ATP-binding protein [Sulfolobus sp. S-194]